MWPDRVSNPGPLTYESGALPTALRGLGITAILYPNNTELKVLPKTGSHSQRKELLPLMQIPSRVTLNEEGAINTSVHGLSFLKVYPPLKISLFFKDCHSH